MQRTNNLVLFGLISAAAILLAISLPRVARAGDSQPKLGGRWQFNKDQSDDAQQKITDAQSNQRTSAYSGGGYPGGGTGGGYPGGGTGRRIPRRRGSVGREAAGWAAAGWAVAAWAAVEDNNRPIAEAR